MASTSKTRTLDLEQVLDEKIDWRYKSFPSGPPTTIRQVPSRNWNVLGGDFMLPVMVLKDSALRHNSKLMASYCKRHDLLLSPHAKTSMAPQLVKMQLDDGAWAVTAATISQVRIWRALGVDRVILANELVEPESVRWVAAEMKADPGFELYCLVDSVAGGRLCESPLGDAGLDRPLHVLLEVGPEGGRTGCRTHEQAFEVARAVAASRNLALAGVEAFEGVIHAESIAASLRAVDGFLDDMRALIVELDAAGLFAAAKQVILTAGGSAYPDRVVAGLGGRWELS